MKKVSLLFALFTITFGFVSCEIDNTSISFDVSTDLNQTILVNVNEQSQVLDGPGSITFELSEEEDIKLSAYVENTTYAWDIEKTATGSNFSIALSMENLNRSTVTFYNNAYTTSEIKVNDQVKEVEADDFVSFEVIPNTEFSFEAKTAGAKGLEITWGPINLTADADESKNSFNVDVSSSYFFLGMKHDKAGEADIDRLVVNTQSAKYKTDEEITLPQDNVTYDVGYYKALSGNTIYAYHANSNDYWKEGTGSNEYYFQYDNEVNQGVDLYTEDLINLKPMKKKSLRISTNKSLLSN